MNAAILAGGGSDDSVATATGAPCKALVQVEGRTLVSYVIEALRDAETVGDICAVEGPTRPISLSDGLRPDLPIVTARGPRFVDTLSAAVEARPDDERVLVVCADLPLLTSKAVDGFVRSCQETQGELSYPIVQAEAFDEAFPGRGKTVAPLREGRFTGGNLAIVTRRFVLEQGSAIARTFDRRKSTIGLAWMFGLRFVARLLLGTLSVEDLERRGGEMLGATLAAVQVPWPEIGFDVDHMEDLELASHFLRERPAQL
ncbi:MAG: nucleotidyltransferase family protein [Armatimonadota bacterium]